MSQSEDLVESLAAAEHDGWSRWMKHVFEASIANPDGSITIPAHLAEQWQRQMQTSYVNLSEEEKASDRREVRKILPIIDIAIRRRTDLGPI